MLPIIGSELIVNLIMTLICIGILFMLVAVSAWYLRWVSERFVPGFRCVSGQIGLALGIAAVYSGYAEAFDQGGYYSSWVDRWMWVFIPNPDFLFLQLWFMPYIPLMMELFLQM